MFAKFTVFFFALAAFINAAPITDYRPIEVGNPIEFGPGPVKIQPVPDASSKRDTTLNLDADFDFGILPGKRASVDVNLGPDGDVGISLPPLRRDYGDIDTTANQIIADSLSKDASQLQGDFDHGLGFDSTE